MATIQTLKAIIAKERNIDLSTFVLSMKRQHKDEEQTLPDEWLSSWDDPTRTRVTMHENVFNQTKADPNRADLVLKPAKIAVAAGSGKEYHHYVVVIPANIEGTF